MSAFLAPIHFWLYNKIIWHEDLLHEILEKSKLNTEITFEENLLSDKSISRPLEEVIDQANIHGWLSEKIASVEKRLASTIKMVLTSEILTLDELQGIYTQNGMRARKNIATPIDTPEALFNAINNYLIDGMPCDRINIAVSSSETEFIWSKNRCVHKAYWDEVGADIHIFYILRDSWLNGFSAPNYSYSTLSNNTFSITANPLTTDSIGIMVEEHQYIKRMLTVIRKICLNILEGSNIPYTDLDSIIDFIRTFADSHHHGKEEEFFFNKMLQHLGPLADKLVTGGMLVEHDLGRLYISQLEAALALSKEGVSETKLDIIANAIAYTDLLKRHIEKEDNVVFPFAQRSFDSSVLEDINQSYKAFEAKHLETRIKYINLLTNLEHRYL